MGDGKGLGPPSFGPTLTSWDDNAARAMKGVVVVRDGDFVGVAAPSAHEAQHALDAIHTQWKEVPQISSKEVFSYLKQNAALKTEDRFRKQKGSVEEGLAGGADPVHGACYTAGIPDFALSATADGARAGSAKLNTSSSTSTAFGHPSGVRGRF